jgi:hypothetical protein
LVSFPDDFIDFLASVCVAQFDGYKRPRVGSLSAKSPWVRDKKVARLESYEDRARKKDGQSLLVCHPDAMAKKAKKRLGKSKRNITEWGIGQPLAFPQAKNLTVTDRLAQETVEEAMRGPLGIKRARRKKK